jgi:hypothetical protein
MSPIVPLRKKKLCCPHLFFHQDDEEITKLYNGLHLLIMKYQKCDLLAQRLQTCLSSRDKKGMIG